ncbi:MAG: cytochrome c-type biogenesis protein [Oceanobacter sp.]
MRSLILSLFCLLALQSHAVVEGYKYPFDSEEEVKQFNELTEELRCPKCQNQNLADSNSPVASDMRSKIYELMQEGQGKQQVIDYMVARYGDFVRYKPPVRGDTLMLWFGPLVVLVIGALVISAMRRSGNKRTVAALTDEEKARLEALRNQSESDPK